MMLQGPNITEMLMHHTADAWTVDLPFGYEWHLPRWPDLHIGSLTVNLSPTKHVVFMLLTAGLVFLSMWLAGRQLAKQQAGRQAPKGYAAAMEGLVLFVRDDICIANIGHDGARFVPLILTLFFFILYANLLGLLPYGSSVTGNLAVTAPLAVLVFLTVEIGGALKLGAKGYLGTIFPHFEGITGVGAVALAVFMAPIEILSKLVKPFALAVRLFGNMTAGHFAILAMYGIIFMFGHLQGWNWAIGATTSVVVVGIMLLELIVAFLQAYVFALLSSVFIGLMQHEH
jgi:F-type H+-transporting ATPase subunit a